MSLKAFKMRVLPVKDKLYRFALRFLKDEDEARDIVQEVFIKVWDRKDKMDQLENIEAWCMRVTRNMAIDRLKSKRFKYTDSIKEGFDIGSGEATPYRFAEANDTMANVRQLIDALPDKQRQIIQLRDVEGYSYKEIAEIMEVDMSQVKVNLFRARKAVKENITNINAYGLQ